MASSTNQVDQKEAVTRLFDDSSDFYTKERERRPYRKVQVEILLSMLEGAKGRILDIGCAAGGEVAELRAKNFEVVGIDLSPAMLKSAQRQFGTDKAVQFCGADIEHLPFASQSMDHVACMGVFEYLSDYSAALNEIHRVLQPGGIVVFAIPTRFSLFTVSETIFNRTAAPLARFVRRLRSGESRRAGSAPVHRNLCEPGRFQERLVEHNFQPGRGYYANVFIYPLDRWVGLNDKVVAALEPVCSIPFLRKLGSLYLISARKA